MPRLSTCLIVSLGTLALTACSLGHVTLPTLPGVGTPPGGRAIQEASAPKPAVPPTAQAGRTTLGGPPAAIQAPTTLQAPADGLELVNALRREKGLAPLNPSPQLMQAARAQAADLARTGKLAHLGTDGSTPLDRVRRTGFKPRMTAENIAGGQASVAEAVASWRQSPSHLQNLLLPDATHAGFAQVNDPRSPLRTYWTIVLARPM